MEEEPGGRCVSVSYLAALFTSFASSDVVGKKLFLKAHLKRLRCYKIQHPHVFLCVCVRANKQAEIDLTPSLQSRLCGSACVSHNQSAGGEVAQLLWLRREGCIALAGKQVRFK